MCQFRTSIHTWTVCLCSMCEAESKQNGIDRHLFNASCVLCSFSLQWVSFLRPEYELFRILFQNTKSWLHWLHDDVFEHVECIEKYSKCHFRSLFNSAIWSLRILLWFCAFRTFDPQVIWIDLIFSTFLFGMSLVHCAKQLTHRTINVLQLHISIHQYK